MKVRVSVIAGNKKEKKVFSDCRTPMDVLRLIGTSPDTVIVLRKKNVIPVDEKLEDGDEIEIIGVVSGG